MCLPPGLVDRRGPVVGHASTSDREALPGDHTADGEKVEPHEAVCPLLEEEVREREAYSQRDQILLSRVRGRALRYPLLPYLSYVQLNSDATLEF